LCGVRVVAGERERALLPRLVHWSADHMYPPGLGGPRWLACRCSHVLACAVPDVLAVDDNTHVLRSVRKGHSRQEAVHTIMLGHRCVQLLLFSSCVCSSWHRMSWGVAASCMQHAQDFLIGGWPHGWQRVLAALQGFVQEECIVCCCYWQRCIIQQLQCTWPQTMMLHGVAHALVQYLCLILWWQDMLLAVHACM
jgi:hypothetical protein